MTKLITFIKSDTFIQLIKYGLVGVGGLIIELILFYLLVKVFHVHYFYSNSLSSLLGVEALTVDQNSSHVISSLVAIINNFILNSYFTFKITDHKVKRFLKFFGIALIGLVASTTLFSIFNSIVGEKWIMFSKGFAVLIIAFVQFIFNKFFTFKNK